MSVEWRPHGFAYAAGQIEGGEEVNIVDVEPNRHGLYRVVKLGGNAIGGSQFGEQAANIAGVMKGGHFWPGLQMDF